MFSAIGPSQELAAAGILCDRFVAGVEGHLQQQVFGHGHAGATLDAREGFHAGLATGVTEGSWQGWGWSVREEGVRPAGWRLAHRRYSWYVASDMVSGLK
jgi:hypothetical protein